MAPRERIKPEQFLACIEISKGSKNKYELEKQTGALILDRILYTSTHYPQNYGFIPLTYAEDLDPLDVLVLSSESIVPLALVDCYPIGVLEMIEILKVKRLTAMRVRRADPTATEAEIDADTEVRLETGQFDAILPEDVARADAQAPSE